MPKSIIIKKNGGPEVLELQDVKVGSPGPHEIKVKFAHFLHWFKHRFLKTGPLLPPPGVCMILSIARVQAHATHISVAQHISKSAPFPYHSLRCRPSCFRLFAIADLRFHASCCRSETLYPPTFSATIRVVVLALALWLGHEVTTSSAIVSQIGLAHAATPGVIVTRIGFAHAAARRAP